MLIGRGEEQARVERLLDQAKHGQSGVLVVRGEPGIGKTTLLLHARDAARGMTVVTATGVESEAELGYSGLLELVRPLLAHLDELPAHQADALREALGFSPPKRRDAFAIGAAVLSLLAAAAEEEPLLVVADDVQWLDRATTDALRFAARRLLADRVALLFGLREGGAESFDVRGFDVLDLQGLDADELRELLARSGVDGVPAETLDRLHEATRGNPLALLEASELLTARELAMWHPTATPLPVGVAIQEAFARRAEALPDRARAALGLAAAASVHDVEVVDRALAVLGLELRDLEPAEDAGLIMLERGFVAFTHPLVRAAIHQAAPASERRTAHAALAESLLGRGLDDRRAWHLASAALGPDETVASALDAIADRSRERGGPAAAAAALEQAARLSSDDGARFERLLGAAEASSAAGTLSTAAALADEALGLAPDDVRRARALELRGRIEGDVGQQLVARDLLLEGAALIEAAEPLEAAGILLTATTPLYFAGDVAGSLATAERARALVPRDGSALDARAEMVLGWALSHAGRDREAGETLERALELFRDGQGVTQPGLQNQRLALDILERLPEADALAPQVDRLAREGGPRALLLALEQQTRFDVRCGAWRHATASGEEAVQIADAMGDVLDTSRLLVLLAVVDAAHGDGERCLERVRRAEVHADAHGLEVLADTARLVCGQLALTFGEIEKAVEILEGVARRSADRGLFARDVTPEPDLVEALVLLGRADEARAWLDEFATRASRASPLWGAALVARGRGLLAGDDFEEHFLEALELHERVEDRFQRARTLLAFGGRLRRAGRKTDARERLRVALELFDELEAAPWFERTRVELRATGERLRRRRDLPGDELTPQELQVALQVAEGKTNKEAAASLFLSPKTVEFHLARVYRKLGVRSRRDLIKRVSSEGVESLAPA